MAKIQSIDKYVIFIALIACHAILSIEGRQLRSMNKKESTSAKASSTEGKKKILPPIGYGDSTTAYKDDFRPPRTGNSPGTGHSFAQDEGDVESKVLSDHSVSAAPSVGISDSMPPPPKHADFSPPAAPGHSPGVGHSVQN